MSEVNEIKEPTTEVNEKPTKEDLLERYAKIQNISIEQAEQDIGAETVEEILKNIEQKTLEKIRASQPPMNRVQRRALKKKMGAKKYAEFVGEGDAATVISETAAKLNYIDLIQKLRKLNEQKENENNGETTTEDD